MRTTEIDGVVAFIGSRMEHEKGWASIVSFLFVFLIVPLLSACPSFVQNTAYKDYRATPLVAKGEPIDDQYDSLVSALVNAHYLNPQCFDSSGTGAAPDTSAVVSPPAEQKVAAMSCRVQRNFIVTDLMSKSRTACEAHKATIFGNEASWNVALGSLTNVFTGTAAVVGGPLGKSIFSALGLFTNAERSLINEEVYQKLLAPAIALKIDDLRNAKATDIRGKLAGTQSTMSNYPMQQALLDVMEYHDDCSFMLGLEMALKEGTGSSINSKYAVLKRTEQDLGSEIDGRKQTLKTANPKLSSADLNTLYTSDSLLSGWKDRLAAVENQLKALEGLQATQPGRN